MTQFGQYPAPAHVIAHISDTHFLGGGKPLYGKVDTQRNLLQAIQQLEESGTRPEAIVFTGDLTEAGEPDAYSRLRQIVEPAAMRMGAQVIWVMGNHDERNRFAADLLDQPETDEPQDRVYNVNGLRIIALDTTVPGYHHGAVTDAQLEWLAAELATPAPQGTLLALHHPPIPTTLDVMALLELQQQERLAEVLRGTDVRGILGGHLHYTTHSTFAGIPVSVAAATCYTMDLSSPPRTLSGIDGAQAFNLVTVHESSIV
ncbi:MAG: phosphodiesterase, partial [Microbacteriaceae bacterium]|nr:phosphodiesterase [Microbacteriaceae bacterium]